MGTRHLVAVQLDGQYRIAQYGQWDGYPSGQGATVLDFLSRWDRPAFEAKLRAARFLDAAALAALGEKWQTTHPHLSRDNGAKILDIVASAPDGIELRNSITFAGDGLFCEYGYVIDLDKNMLEVFKGFGKDKLADDERFAKAPAGIDSDYAPIKLQASYPLSRLPTVDELVKDVEGEDIDD